MKVVVVDQTGDKAGGAQLSLESFLRNVPSGVQASVVFFEDGAYAGAVTALGISTHVLALDDAVKRATRESMGLRSLVRLPGTIRKLVALLRELDPDVVYTNGVKAHFLGAVSARLLGRPCVVHYRDLLTGPARIALLAVAATCTRARIATSRNVARCFPLPNTTIVDNPVELDAYVDLPSRMQARAGLTIADGPPIAGIIGRLNRWKRIDRFIRAIATVNELTPLRGLIVGAPRFRDADLLPELLDLRARLRLDELVRFVDWVDDPRDVYAAIDINVNTSEREPFGRTIIEAAACGIPSVCFDDAGVSETMESGRTGIVAPAADEAALSAALFAYASDEDYRKRAGAAAREWSSRFDATLYARRVSDVLITCARRTRNRRR